LWRARRQTAFLAGVIFALAASAPLVNLLAPIFAAAAMTHLVEGWRRELEAGRS
jgi:uncharacterized protein involved in cysteine biosynthesis